jgi:hypothetical protein
VGANLEGGQVGADSITGARTTFKGAFLQDADFTNVAPTDTSFVSAYVDLTGNGMLTFQIPSSNLAFAGYWGNDPECVQVSYNSSNSGFRKRS